MTRCTAVTDQADLILNYTIYFTHFLKTLCCNDTCRKSYFQAINESSFYKFTKNTKWLDFQPRHLTSTISTLHCFNIPTPSKVQLRPLSDILWTPYSYLCLWKLLPSCICSGHEFPPHKMSNQPSDFPYSLLDHSSSSQTSDLSWLRRFSKLWLLSFPFKEDLILFMNEWLCLCTHESSPEPFKMES